jgi:transposase
LVLTRFPGHIESGQDGPLEVRDGGTEQVPTRVRRDAVALVRSTGRPVRRVARELGMSSETLRNWLKQDRIDQGELEGLTSTEREELRRLRREVAELKLERDLLVKAAAFFAKETTR